MKALTEKVRAYFVEKYGAVKNHSVKFLLSDRFFNLSSLTNSVSQVV